MDCKNLYINLARATLKFYILQNNRPLARTCDFLTRYLPYTSKFSRRTIFADCHFQIFRGNNFRGSRNQVRHAYFIVGHTPRPDVHTCESTGAILYFSKRNGRPLFFSGSVFTETSSCPSLRLFLISDV